MMKIDGREPDKLKYHEWDMDTEVVENMKIGDYVISESICIERKEINDLVKSLDNRVWEQVMNMEENYDINILIVIGRISDLSSYNMEPRKISAVYGSLARLAITYDVEVFWFREQSQFIKMVNKLHSKGGDKEKREKPHIEKRNFRDDRINVICGVHGVGYETAKNLLDELDSVSGIASASKEELRQAHGVGEKTAKKIYDIMHNGEGEEKLL